MFGETSLTVMALPSDEDHTSSKTTPALENTSPKLEGCLGLSDGIEWDVKLPLNQFGAVAKSQVRSSTAT
jgi:hypothetical protein